MAPAPDHSPPPPTPTLYGPPWIIGSRTFDGSLAQGTPPGSGIAVTDITSDPYAVDHTGSMTFTTNKPWRSGASEPSATPQLSHNGPKVFVAAGAIVAVLVIVISLCCFLLLLRKRRIQRRRAAAQAQARGGGAPEMDKNTAANAAHPADTRAYIRTPPDNPPAMVASPSTTSAQSGPQSPPVLLSTTMDHSYYTGIDTSDHISLVDSRSQASSEEANDEPPPPYRPRSVPPISRDNSVRYSNGIPAHRNSVRSRDHMRSPFDDPQEEDDGVVSDLEDTIPQPPSTRRVETDELSAVSDMSYQRDPTTTHSTV